MTISSLLNRVNYNGNDVTQIFAVSFPFRSSADLVVLSTVITTGVQTTKTLITHYTISGTPDALGYYSNGGSVTMLVAPASTERLTIYRNPARLQELNLPESGNLPAESVEAEFDYLTMLLQRVYDLISRSLRQPDGDSANIGVLPSSVDRASKFQAYDANGDPIASAGTSANLGPVSAYIDTLLDDSSAAIARNTLGANLAAYVATVGGTGDAITLFPSPAITAYAAGQMFQFVATGLNTTAVTISISSLAQKAVTKNGTVALSLGDIVSGALVSVMYDGTQFQRMPTNAFAKGTWTPSVGGTATYTTQTGVSHQIGRLVLFSFVLTINVLGTGSPSVITGLSQTALTGGAGVNLFVQSSLAVSVVELRGTVSGATITLVGRTAAATGLTTQAALGNGASISGQGWFEV